MKNKQKKKNKKKKKKYTFFLIAPQVDKKLEFIKAVLKK